MLGALIGAGVGLWNNERNRGDANNYNAQSIAAQNRGLDMQQEQLDMAKQRYEMILDIIKKGEFEGIFNSEANLANYDKDWSRGLALNQGNLMGAMKLAGYRPGDSELTIQANDITSRALDERSNFAYNARRQGLFDHLNAYSALDPSASQAAANSATTANQNSALFYQNLANQSKSQIQNPTTLLASVMPYLSPQKQTTLAGPSGAVQNAGMAALINRGRGGQDLLHAPGGTTGGGLNW